ncbi:hypothetical protein OG693_39830 [Streptomyces sp. NBC_01259]|uniref:hypothetical protein n=1 Tax=Streptomyces sp. NBC_01259 TaxID=2903800 RepID=UPI00324D0790
MSRHRRTLRQVITDTLARLTAPPRSPLDKPHIQNRQEALQEAADWVITSRFRLTPDATLTPDMVVTEVEMRAGLSVEWGEAAEALLTRLRFRGYIA